MKYAFPLLILFFTLSAFAQSDLPEIGSLADIKGKTKLYLHAETANKKWMLKEIKKYPSLVVVNSPNDAEFFIEYRTLKRAETARGVAELLSEQGQLDVYVMRDGGKTIVWTEGGQGGWKGAPYITFTRKFLREFLPKNDP